MTLSLIAALFCMPAGALGTTEQKHIVGNGSVGNGVGKQTTLVDFTASDLCGFETLGNIADRPCKPHPEQRRGMAVTAVRGP